MRLRPCAALAAALACAEPAGANPSPNRQVVYKEPKGGDLRLHIFEPDGWRASDRRPAIVFFFGGGWVGGHPRQFYPHCRHLADLGMVAISAEYRTAKSHGTSPFACVEDGKSALRYLRQHAGELGVDPGRVAAAGGSAGGHVAACTGTVSGFETGDRAISSAPQAMVLFNPVCDTSPEGYGAARLGGRWREISPRHHISDKTPPACIFHGSADTAVPHENAAGFRAAMTDAGRRCELHTYRGAKHGFFNHGRGGNRAYLDTLAKMDTFLASLGFIDRAAATGGGDSGGTPSPRR